MDENQWKVFHKKKSTNHKFPAPCGSHTDSLEVSTPLDDSQTKWCKPSVVSQSELEKIADDECVDQTDIKSLIGTPFIVRRRVELDENPTAKISKEINVGKSGSSVPGLLRLNPDRVTNETDLMNIRDESTHNMFGIDQMNEIEWPCISETQTSTANDENSVNTHGDGKSWSTVLKTAPHSQSTSEIKSSSRKGDKGGNGERGGNLITKKQKKKKKESGQLSTAMEKRSDQPLLLEFESLFESLQVKGSKKVIASGGAPLLLSKPPTKQDAHLKITSRGGNILDSSAPAARRGKEREVPKKKRPSALRKVISDEKEKKKAGAHSKLDTTVTSDPSTETAADVRSIPSIHNRRFREYCNHLVKDEINSCVENFLGDLVRFQDRMYLKDPIKAKAKRRYVCGLREVLKHLNLKKLKCVILPPNLDMIESKGGINDVIQQILAMCFEQQLPVIFAMSRRRLALVLKKSHKVGCVGIFNYDGAEVHYKSLMALVETARTEYEAKISTMAVDNSPYSRDTTLRDDELKCDSVELDVHSESSCESNDSEVDDDATVQQQNLLSSPWKIFFEHSARGHNQLEKPNEPSQLNINASEFIPSFHKLNVDAKEFVPIL